MIIFRYLAKEVFLTLIALTAILMLIFLSNQFVQYLNRAASGSIPGMIIFKLMVLELPNLMSLLLPLGFYMALLLAYGRLYAENEMTVLRACGYGPLQLLKHSFLMASLVTLIVAVMILWLSPHISLARAKLLHAAGVKTLIQMIIPGRFQSLDNRVFFVQSMSRDHTQADRIFLAQHDVREGKLVWDLLWAKHALVETDPKTHTDHLVLKDGQLYQGIPGQADYQIAEFLQYRWRLPQPEVVIKNDIRTLPTSSLWSVKPSDPRIMAELQWRVSIPLMVFILTLIAVPLSRINPRGGKYSKLLPALIIFILYANGLFIARDAVNTGKISPWFGLWGLHLLFVVLGLFLVWRSRAKLA